MAETKLESRLGTVLFDNDDNALSGSITLSESAANFSYLKIFFKSNDGDYSSIDVYHPNGKTISLMVARISDTNASTWLKTKDMLISGTIINTISPSSTYYTTGQVNIITNPNIVYGDYINITTVLGFR